MDLTTIRALKKFGSFQAESDEGLLAALISASSRAIETHTGRTFAVAEETTHVFTRRLLRGVGYTDPFDGPVLLLDEDLADVPSLITGTSTINPAVAYLPAYEKPYWGILIDEGTWQSPVSVTGYWAYSVQPPPEIELATLRLAKWMYELRETTRGDSVVVTDQGAVLLPSALPADVLAIINPFRATRFAR